MAADNGIMRCVQGFHHTGTDRDIAQSVNHNKGAGFGVVLVAVNRNRGIQAKLPQADFVELEFIGRQVAKLLISILCDSSVMRPVTLWVANLKS